MPRKRSTQPEPQFEPPLSKTITRILMAFLFAFIAFILLLSFTGQAGKVGGYLLDTISGSIGYIGVLWFTYISGFVAFRLFKNETLVPRVLPALGFTFAIPSILSLQKTIGLPVHFSGVFGSYLEQLLSLQFGFAGTLVIPIIGILLASIFFSLHSTLIMDFFEKLFGITKQVHAKGRAYLTDKKLDLSNGKYEEDEDEEIEEEMEVEEIEQPLKKQNEQMQPLLRQAQSPLPEKSIPTIKDGSTTYQAPPLSLLKKSSGKPNIGNIEELSDLIEQTLHTFGIPVTMDEVTIGPSVTRFAMKPAPGVKLSKIIALQSNLELALATQVRIEAPIPGKSLVGIEIPNPSKATIGLGSLVGGAGFKIAGDKPLYFSIGMNIENQPIYADLAKLPHLLIAGTTGAGKSATVHNIILSLLYRNGPDSLRMIMVDPKRVELTLYSNIPHLLTPVIKTAKQAVLSLKWAVKEMERRYDVLESHKVQNISSYHKNILKPALDAGDGDTPERMPYIVIVIDEMSDLMQSFPKELESAIVRLAQMSRAVGIHLILSTQRPSVNVITGLIKANVPGRIALRVSSQIDSRTIMDTGGAEKLLGAGDLLFTGNDSARPIRIQAAYASEDEVKEVVAYINKHNDPELNTILFGNQNTESGDDGGGIIEQHFSDDDDDDLYDDAKQAVIQAGKASTSYIQRKLRVGYSRAARLIDMLESRGVIGPADGAKPRSVFSSGSSVRDNRVFDDEITENDNEEEYGDNKE